MPHRHLASRLLETVTPEHLQKAVDGLCAGTHPVEAVACSDHQIRAFVGPYSVVLQDGHSFCSCKDAMYRGGICKHQVVLALHCLRTQPAAEQQPAAPDLSLGKVRRE
jgi:hypothetical protein